jgi:hypothetical protein
MAITLDGSNLTTSGVINRGTAVASTSGTTIDFTIPTGANRITVMFSGVSLSGTDNILIKLGTSGGIVSSGYNSACGNISTTTASVVTSSAGFVSFFGTSAALSQIGSVTLTNITSNVWVAAGVTRSSTANINYLAGDISLGGTLTTVQIATNGSNTFDAGIINILYE